MNVYKELTYLVEKYKVGPEKLNLEITETAAAHTPEILLKNVKESIDDFVGKASQFDDITMLGFRYLGK